MLKRSSVKEAEWTAGDDEWCDSFTTEDSSLKSDSSCPSVIISSNEKIDETEELWIGRLSEIGIPVERSEFETKFEEIGTLGKGAYGSVCMVKEKATGRTFAMKRVDVPLNPSWLRKGGHKYAQPSSPEFTPPSSPSSPPATPLDLVHVSTSSALPSSDSSPTGEARDPIFDKLAARLLREVHAMASLGHHQHLVKFHYAWLEVKACAPKATKKPDVSVETNGSSLSGSGSFLRDSHAFNSIKNDRSSDSGTSPEDLFPTRSAKSKSFSTDVSDHSEDTSSSSIDTSGFSKDFVDWNGGRAQLVKSGNGFFKAPCPLTKTHNLTLFIQMELCSSESLHSWLRSPERSFVDRNLSLRLFSQLMSALSHIHENGFFHRDVKPDNLFMLHDPLRREPVLKLGDFGLSKRLPSADLESLLNTSPSSLSESQKLVKDMEAEEVEDEVDEFSAPSAELSLQVMELIRHTQGRGTAMYMAPEVWNGRRYDEKVDVYAAGIVLYELFHCFGTGSERIVALTKLKEERDVGERMERDYPDIARVVLAMTHPDPECRPHATDITKHLALATKGRTNGRRVVVESDGESEEEMVY